MKRAFIVNPTARRGSLRRRLPKIAARVREKFGAFDPILTQSWEDARDQTRRALHEGADQIIALGGDGTLNAVVNGFFERDHAIRPEALLVATDCGTGSDYFKSVAPDFDGDWLDLAANFEAMPVDLGVVERTEPGSAHFFLNLASLGISAETAARKLTLPLPGPLYTALSYSLPAARALFTYRAIPAHVRAPGLDFQGKLLALFAAKGRFAGGGLPMGGGVALSDGLLDVTVIEDQSIVRRIRKFWRLMREGLRPETGVQRQACPWLEISGPPTPIECDGELRGTSPVRLSVRPKAVRVCCPPKKNLY